MRGFLKSEGVVVEGGDRGILRGCLQTEWVVAE